MWLHFPVILLIKTTLSLEINWYSYIKQYPGLSIDSNSYSTFKHNLMFTENCDMSPFIHISKDEFTDKFKYKHTSSDKFLYPIQRVISIFDRLPEGKYFNWLDKGITYSSYQLEPWISTVKNLIEIKGQQVKFTDNFEDTLINNNLDNMIDIYSSPFIISLSLSQSDIDSLQYPSGVISFVGTDEGKGGGVDEGGRSVNCIGLVVGYGKIAERSAERSKGEREGRVGGGRSNDYWIVDFSLGYKFTFKINPYSSAIIGSYTFK